MRRDDIEIAVRYSQCTIQTTTCIPGEECEAVGVLEQDPIHADHDLKLTRTLSFSTGLFAANP